MCPLVEKHLTDTRHVLSTHTLSVTGARTVAPTGHTSQRFLSTDMRAHLLSPLLLADEIHRHPVTFVKFVARIADGKSVADGTGRPQHAELHLTLHYQHACLNADCTKLLAQWVGGSRRPLVPRRATSSSAWSTMVTWCRCESAQSISRCLCNVQYSSRGLHIHTVGRVRARTLARSWASRSTVNQPTHPLPSLRSRHRPALPSS